VVSDPSKFIDLAARFRRHAEPFRSLGLQARAELYAVAGWEAWGIWVLMPKDRETESAWVTFSLLASLAIEELGIPPTPAPQALEFDPTWREQCTRMQVDSSETLPAGLDAVDACTRAWLHFLRCESLRNGSSAFQPRSAGGSFPDVWEASAAQCERSAREGIQTRLNPDNGTAAQEPKERRKVKKPARRSEKYERIDKALREFAAARPKSHEEVFRLLDDRKVAIPNRRPFKSAGGWLKGFRQNSHSASAWLSQAWGRLSLPAFPRGPQK
jgi:hypothetical protein